MVDSPLGEDDVLSSSSTNYPRWQDHHFSCTKSRTDGEAPERGWANIDPVAAQTKQMGPASRRETLDDHFMAHVRMVRMTRL